MNNEKGLEALLGEIKERKKPLFIELAGTPDSGKSTIAGILDNFFRRHNFRVFKIQEGPEHIRHISRSTYLYNIATAIYGFDLCLKFLNDARYDIVIFDRLLFDAYCWMEYWHQKKMISEETKNKIQDFFTNPDFVNLLNNAFFIVCEAEEAIKRDQKYALSDKFGETTNPNSIKNLIKIWQGCFIKLPDRFKGKLTMVETADINPRQAAEIILNEILKNHSD